MSKRCDVSRTSRCVFGLELPAADLNHMCTKFGSGDLNKRHIVPQKCSVCTRTHGPARLEKRDLGRAKTPAEDGAGTRANQMYLYIYIYYSDPKQYKSYRTPSDEPLLFTNQQSSHTNSNIWTVTHCLINE